MTQPKKTYFWWKLLFVGLPLFFAINWVYHAVHKPAEVIGLLDSQFYKSPSATWSAYGEDFKSHATNIITPDFLAALAQAETQGNAIARTYWQWKFSLNPFEIYSPASSATGLFQITDGTFKRTKKFCIQNGEAVKDDKNMRCWFNDLYNRLIPSHAIEMTSAYLHYNVVQLLKRYRLQASTSVKQNLATIIHLCGPQKAEQYARRHFNFSPGEKCGAHDPTRYLRKVNKLREFFSKHASR